MFKRKKFTDAFLQVSKEHIIYQQYINQLKDLIHEGTDAGNFDLLKKIVLNIKNDLLDHFQLEEQVLFPAALLSLPSVEMADQILLLTREHGAFERDTETLIQIVNCQPADNQDIPQQLIDFLKTYTDNLDQHARTEMDELFPKLDADKKCIEVIRDFVE